MKRLSILLVLLIAATTLVAAQSSPPAEVRVHVLPVVNRSGQAQFDAVATTVTGTVSLTLRLLGDYEISQGEAAEPTPLPPEGAAREEALATLAAELAVENIVFSEVLPPVGDELPRIRLGVYDRLTRQITVQEERTPQSLFGIFTVTDELASDVLSGFAGRRVAFGSVQITPEYAGTGAPPPYRVALDGEALGANLRSVDSILTGTHQLTITMEVLGEERVLLNEEISVNEGATREVVLELPDLDLVAEEQNRARRHAETLLQEALRVLEVERRTLDARGTTAPTPPDYTELPASRRLYLSADEYIDPAAIREAALTNAHRAARLQIAAGQTWLSRREFAEGVEDHVAVSDLAHVFDRDDLFGYGDQIGFATSSYGEILVQEERNPSALLPWLLFGAAFAVTIPTGESPFVEAGPPMAQYVPFLPTVFAGVSTAIWNATDWDYRPSRRLLRRYGRDGMDAPERLRPWPEWEVAPGITATMGFNGYRITPGPSGTQYGVGTIRVGQASFAPALRVRHWLTPRHAVGGELRVASLAGFQDIVTLSETYGYTIENDALGVDYSELDIAEFFSASLDWSHTRTGRTILDTGLTVRLLEFSTENIRHNVSILAEETYGELLGGSTAFVAIPGVRTGFGLRFGRGKLPPWEFALHYRLERAAFPTGVLADEGPFYLSRFDATIRRSILLGAADSQSDDTRSGASDRDSRTIAEARAGAETRWTPHPLLIYADPGGFLTRGARIGLEYELTPRWSVGVHGRWAASLAMAEIIPDVTTLQQPEFAWPGVSLRWYEAPRTLDHGAREAGWYVGGVVEYGWFDLPPVERVRPADEVEFVTNSGSLWFVLAEVGYRRPIGRSGFLDVGVQAGGRLGEGYTSRQYLRFADGTTEDHAVTTLDAGTWIYPTLSVGTRLY